MNVKNTVVHIFFPNKCPSCHKIIEPDSCFCSDCNAKITRAKSKNRCKVCFSKNEKCDCKKNPKFFKRLVAPFEYEGTIKSSLITYKKIKLSKLTKYFGREMSNSINDSFSDFHFDCIIPVPLYKKDYSSRGYNQAYEFSKEISKNLNIPINTKMLVKNKKSKRQHMLGFEDRKKNVSGVYCVNVYNYNIKNILLVDDISTSGNTLSECAKVLRIAGAEKVYCVTVAKT